MGLGKLNTSLTNYVTVLLSTYNGSRYLPQQLDSLYQQTYSNIRILVRDDGSTDGTLAILATAQSQGHIELMASNRNMGPPSSFLTLLKQAALTDTAYVAFCDQDDVWLPEKLARAVSLLNGTVDRPAMVCTQLELVDEALQPIEILPVPKKIGFGNALVENVAIGCTIVLNRSAINLLYEYFPDRTQMHDWWCYLVLSCMGEVIFDPVPSILYRQHGNNTVGVDRTWWARYAKRFRRFFGKTKQRTWCSDHATMLLQGYGNLMPPANRALLVRLQRSKTNLLTRLGLVFSGAIWRQSWSDNLILRILLLMNRL